MLNTLSAISVEVLCLCNVFVNSKYKSTFGLRCEHNNYDRNKDTYILRAMSSNAHAWAHLKKILFTTTVTIELYKHAES